MAENFQISSARLFKAKVYIMLLLLKENYDDAVTLCTIDKSLLLDFAIGFVERHKNDLGTTWRKIDQEGWQLLTVALQECDNKAGDVAKKVLSTILDFKSQIDEVSTSIRHLKPLHQYLMKTNLLAYAQALMQQHWLEEAVNVLRKGFILNQALVNYNCKQFDERDHKSLIIMAPYSYSEVVAPY